LRESVIRRVMKSVFSAMLTLLANNVPDGNLSELRLESELVTVRNYDNVTRISVVADDGFIYPIEDVDDINEWNTLTRYKSYIHSNNNTILLLNVSLMEIKKETILDFSKSTEPLRTQGPEILKKEIVKLLNIN
jgi:hypothetical protein